MPASVPDLHTQDGLDPLLLAELYEVQASQVELILVNANELAPASTPA